VVEKGKVVFGSTVGVVRNRECMVANLMFGNLIASEVFNMEG
jgi:hypothetical protein